MKGTLICFINYLFEEGLFKSPLTLKIPDWKILMCWQHSPEEPQRQHRHNFPGAEGGGRM